MTWWEALIMGIVQGLTEFFPVSSSGHLVITDHVLGLDIPGITFDVLLHVATLISVLIVYRDRVIWLLSGALGRTEDNAWPYILKLVVATIPAGLVGILFKDWFSARFDDPAFAGTMILVTGAVVWSARWARTDRAKAADFIPIVMAAAFSLLAGTLVPFLAVLGIQAVIHGVGRVTASRDVEMDQPGWVSAILMGLAQAVAIFPGISRSGSTVIAGLWRRVDPIAAAEFSFLMSVIAITGAAVLEVPEAMREGIAVAPLSIAVGFVAALVSGVVAIRFFVALLRNQQFHHFSWYCWAAAGAFLLYIGGA